MQEKNTEKTKKQVSHFIFPILEVRFSKGEKIFSFLKPSKTESNMNKVARVLQSIFAKSSLVGGVIKREIIAAKSDTESISSFLKTAMILLNIRMIVSSLCIKIKNTYCIT